MIWYYNITIGVSAGYSKNALERLQSRLERGREDCLHLKYGKIINKNLSRKEIACKGRKRQKSHFIFIIKLQKLTRITLTVAWELSIQRLSSHPSYHSDRKGKQRHSEIPQGSEIYHSFPEMTEDIPQLVKKGIKIKKPKMTF